jgi:Aspartyl/Asparaginyl beta-hydroxylase
MDMKDYYFSDVKFLKLAIPVDYKSMLDEAISLKHRFTAHRYADENHQGWLGLTLYGLGESLHESWQDYGYENAVAAAKNYVWTAAAMECPSILGFLKHTFPCQRFGRVRLMLVEAGGFIGPHIDTKHSILENINIPLSNPKGCVWKWGDGEELFMEPGGAYAMNISYEHSVHNNSDVDRYHLIVSRHDSTDSWKQLIEQAAAQAGVTGYYKSHVIAV